MNEGQKPKLNRKLFKESCFGTYVLSPGNFKSHMLTKEACDVVKNINDNRTVADLVDLARMGGLDTDAARKRVDAVIGALRKLGALQLE